LSCEGYEVDESSDEEIDEDQDVDGADSSDASVLESIFTKEDFGFETDESLIPSHVALILYVERYASRIC
jgi:hypothetical protein